MAGTDEKDLTARLRYIYPEGATKALQSLGWTEQPKDEGCCPFTKNGQRPAVFGVTPANIYPRALMARMLEPLDFTYEEFEDAYIAAYNGEPPLVPF